MTFLEGIHFFIPGVLVTLPGVFFGVLAGVLLDRVDLFSTFMGVFTDILRFAEALSADSLHALLELSFVLRCHRIGGPLDNGASILSKLFMSFSKLKCDIVDHLQQGMTLARSRLGKTSVVQRHRNFFIFKLTSSKKAENSLD